MATKAETNLGWTGHGPWQYTVLSGTALTDELQRLSAPTSVGTADAVTFQPSPKSHSQDRYVVHEWEIGATGQHWKFAGVFDGHGGEATSEHIVDVFPDLVRQSLEQLLSNSPEDVVPAVSDLLVKSIRDFDEGLALDLFGIFPGGLEEATGLSDDELKARMSEGDNQIKFERCMSGTTALISLLDPAGANLWVASLGDCNAVVGTQTGPEQWQLDVTDGNHNGNNSEEAARVRQEHPGEDECVMETPWGTRVLGAIAITRAAGDYHFKLPLPWIEVSLRVKEIKFSYTSLDAWKARIRTPPYLSNVAGIRHIKLDPLQDGHKRFLIMSSDGLYDLRPEEDMESPVTKYALGWLKAAAKAQDAGGNLAMEVLRQGLGGEDEAKVSAMLTLESEGRWTDDITVIVKPL
ncbi:protein serine/threonine phosphatase 2C [Punctularia strigosozonata HHB-11173 SS5]|uniref:Protein serine/threonine phosphatase 2C n=1 Tax=Punctularia strigosozonata (strain HHB-11173) TaxID=741275 RepID=R7S2E8_PUNST|nr:protein serine/threonine phosphatase 2C [Punctularia strigosozonata HHB-11173 SS5]EIN04378.1 protein serine/threonine phosphatase 2C [Punctularia strigosozonata HHB-11173 SS5]